MFLCAGRERKTRNAWREGRHRSCGEWSLMSLTAKTNWRLNWTVVEESQVTLKLFLCVAGQHRRSRSCRLRRNEGKIQSELSKRRNSTLKFLNFDTFMKIKYLLLNVFAARFVHINKPGITSFFVFCFFACLIENADTSFCFQGDRGVRGEKVGCRRAFTFID